MEQTEYIFLIGLKELVVDNDLLIILENMPSWCKYNCATPKKLKNFSFAKHEALRIFGLH
jgi:hypothetical protein